MPQAAVMWEAHGCVRGWCRAVIRADAPAAGASLCTDLARRERPLAQPHDSLRALRSHPSKPLAYLPQPPPGPRQAAFAWAPGPTARRCFWVVDANDTFRVDLAWQAAGLAFLEHAGRVWGVASSAGRTDVYVVSLEITGERFWPGS